MSYFSRQDGELFVEQISLKKIAKKYGTPCYVYSKAGMEKNWLAYHNSFNKHPHLICFSVKANSNLGVLNVLARLGSGFDIVSIGELERVIKAGGDPKKVVFSGVGKQIYELERALEVGIKCFNVESEAEMLRLNQVAKSKSLVAPIALRVNPNVDAKTHPYISTGLMENKFGIEISEAFKLYKEAKNMEHLKIIGVDFHIGSQITSLDPFLSALDNVILLINDLKNHGIDFQHIDIGGGLGISYQKNENPPLPSDYVDALFEKLKSLNYEIILEPGRSIIGNTGVLLTRVEYLKSNDLKNFAIVDAAMNDLIRPSLYNAFQTIESVEQQDQISEKKYDLVGPVCETADFLAKSRLLSIESGTLLVVHDSGAYGFSMSSNYNSRPRVAEIIVDGTDSFLVRKREKLQDLFVGESILP
tara:strand:+ start:566 stop:1816 length:1251 start_codon:yes stop_codon:yes gene_type:complete